MAFDGITCKAIAYELDKLSGAVVDKIYQPNKNSIIMGLYFQGENYVLNCSIDPAYYRVNLTKSKKQNPKVAPNFCMVLRKHLTRLRIKNVYTIDLERVIFIEFEGFNEFDDIINMKLIIELMGKHSNIILVDEAGVIVDSLRHIKSAESNYRDILPHCKYVFPTTEKLNFYEIKNFNEFNNKISEIAQIPTKINGIGKVFIHNSEAKTLEEMYELILNTLNNIECLEFKALEKDYILEYKKEDKLESDEENFKINYAIDKYYTTKENSANFKVYRDSVLKLILATLKKYNKRLINIQNKLEQCENRDKYKLYGELITANLYKIDKKNLEYIELENYYENNEKVKIPLDKKYSPNENARRYFKKYNKLKNAQEVVTKQKEETIKELNYIESVVYEIENCETLEGIDEIYEEISENEIFKTKKTKTSKIKLKKTRLTKNKTVKFNPIKYIVKGHTVLVGRNNKENDYLTIKHAKKTDYWFHTKDIHGSHVILKVNPNEKIEEEVFIKCAQIAAYYSKARNSSNVPIDYCLVKYVKKPNGAKPGMVIYTNNKTLNVNPKL